MIRELGVVIPVHGSIGPVLLLLEQIIGTAVPREDRPARVLLVDDASPRPLPVDDLPPGVELIRREANGGFGAAVNTGLKALETELVLVLNSDLSCPPGFVRALVEHAAPWQPAVVGCRAVGEDGGSEHAARLFPTIGHHVVEWLVPLASQRHRPALHRAVGHDTTAENGTGMVPVDWVSGAVLLLPREEVLAIGGFDEGYFMYTEEVDLQLRLRRSGVPSLFDADLTVVHTGGGSAGDEARRLRWLVGARMRYARQHADVHLLRAGMTAATAVNLAWNVGRRVAGREVRPFAVARRELALIYRAEAGARWE